jgi:hypothetical protein
MGIQGPSNCAPAILDYLFGKLLGLGFCLEFAGRASGPALSIVALGRNVRTIGNVPDIVISQVPTSNKQTELLGCADIAHTWFGMEEVANKSGPP